MSAPENMRIPSELAKNWFWLATPDQLSLFESDASALGYEVLRRSEQFAPKEGQHNLAHPQLFHKPWAQLGESEKGYFRFYFSSQLSQIGITYHPPVIGNKCITFRCDQPTNYLITAAKTFMDAAVRLRELAEQNDIRSSAKMDLMVSYQAFQEEMRRRQIAQLAARHDRRNQNNDRRPRTHLSYPVLAAGYGMSGGLAIIPKLTARPSNDGRKPRTPRQYFPKVSNEDLVTIELPLPFITDSRKISGEYPVKQESVRPMYTDEILTFFSTFLRKPPKKFAKYRSRMLLTGRFRLVKPRTITLGLMAMDAKAASPQFPLKYLASELLRKPCFKSVKLNRFLTALSNAAAANGRLQSRL